MTGEANTLQVVCEICGCPGRKNRRTCSTNCKRKLQAFITKKQFSDPEKRHVHSVATRAGMMEPEARSKFEAGMLTRRSYKGEGHPSYGKERTPLWRNRISAGNKGKLKGKTWDEIMGPVRAAERRLENATTVAGTNARLLDERTSDVEKTIAKLFLPFGFIGNMQIGRYTVDLLNETTKEIIEVYGLYWHCHPRLFADTQMNWSLGMTAFERRQLDAKRIQYLIDRGYSVKIFWEDEEDAVKAAIADYRRKKEQKT